ncbi:MAG: 5'-3' exonuclease H3TH domain-containing protein [Myxococcota bacterium]
MNVHLIDGTFELFRAYYGGPSRTNRDGHEVGATRTFLRSLQRLLARDDVTHVACAFDRVIESFRNELFPGYKTGDGIEPNLRSQFSWAERAAEALGVVVWPMVEFECDDAIATGAKRYATDARVERVVICSPDKDFAQCVSAKVHMWDRMRDLWYDASQVREKWGIEPASMPDYLALVGDHADGIPGVARWGAKSSARVLARYHHLESIPTDPAAWEVDVRGAVGLSHSLETRRDAAMLYRRLATLRVDVPLGESLDALEYQGPDRDRFASLTDALV